MVQGPTLVAAIIILMLLALYIQRRVHVFLVLLCAAGAMGFIAGMEPFHIARTLITGFSVTIEKIGMIIIAGGVLSVVLERSGAIKLIVEAILESIGRKRPVLAMSIIGYVVGIPVMCDTGYVLLTTLNKTLMQKTGIPVVSFAVALATGLLAAHTLVPPTPGPIAAAAVLHADIWVVLGGGLVIAMLATVVGYLWICSCEPVNETSEIVDDQSDEGEEGKSRATVCRSFVVILIPVIMIALKAVAHLPGESLGNGGFKSLVDFAGEPVVALLLGVLLAFGLLTNLSEEVLRNWVGAGINCSAEILVVTAAGGSLGLMLTLTGIGQCLAQSLLHYNMGIFMPFLVTAVLKTAHGSTMGALLTASIIIAPQLAMLGLATPVGAALATLAIGAGAMTVSHINDPYFWLVARSADMRTETALRLYTMATLLMGITAIVMVKILQILLLP